MISINVRITAMFGDKTETYMMKRAKNSHKSTTELVIVTLILIWGGRLTFVGNVWKQNK